MAENILIYEKKLKYEPKLRRYVFLWGISVVCFGIFCGFVCPNIVPLSLPIGLIYIPLGGLAGAAIMGTFFLPLIISTEFFLARGKELVLRVDGEGVYANRKRMYVDSVLWEDVEKLRCRTMEGRIFIEFVLKDENKFLRKCAKRTKRELRIRKALGYGLISLPLEGFEIPAEELFERMQMIFEKTRQTLPYTIE